LIKETEGGPPAAFFLDIDCSSIYNNRRSQSKYVFGVPDDPAEIKRNRALTREPDTVSTVGGKDA